MVLVPSERTRFDVLGVEIDAVTTASTIARLSTLLEKGSSGYVVFCTVSTVLSARDDRRVRAALAGASIVTPDGMPLVWLGKKAANQPIERVYGPDFMLDVFASTAGRFSHFFYGGHDGVASEMVARLTERFPDLRVAGYLEPAMDLAIDDASPDLSVIEASGADLVWVGLGHPKQELWMQRHCERLSSSALLGVGAAFDFHAGRKKEAPRWMKRRGLQWLHRLAKEPRRLWRRYVWGNTRFLGLLVAEKLRKQR